MSVVVPARDEESTLPTTLPVLVDELERLAVPAEVVVVVPETSPFARSGPVSDPRLTWATVGAPGKHAALRVGVERSAGEVLVFQDADVVPSGGALGRLLDELTSSGADVAAGRIVHHELGGDPTQRLLEAWAAVSIEAWHRLRAERPDLRWALPGALYAFHRRWFPDGDLLVPMLDDASIGMSMVERGAHVVYVPQARVEVTAARSLAQWYRQKLRIRRGWRSLKDVRSESVGELQRTLSAYSRTLCRRRPDLHLVRLADRAMAAVAERSRPSAAEQDGAWQPDRHGWTIRSRLTTSRAAAEELETDRSTR